MPKHRSYSHHERDRNDVDRNSASYYDSNRSYDRRRDRYSYDDRDSSRGSYYREDYVDDGRRYNNKRNHHYEQHDRSSYQDDHYSSNRRDSQRDSHNQSRVDNHRSHSSNNKFSKYRGTEDVKTKRNGDDNNKKKKSANRMPDGWHGINFGYNPVHGTMLIPIKVPLSPNVYPHSFNLFTYVEKQKKSGREIGMIIDLTASTRYYSEEDIPEGITRVHIICEGHTKAPGNHLVKKFLATVDTFTSENPGKYILVHCTHGVNRTGFMICNYLIKMGYSIEQSLKIFAYARTIAIYNPILLDALFAQNGQTSSEMYTGVKYPALAEKKDIRKKYPSVLAKRGLSIEDFDFTAQPKATDLSQFDHIDVPGLSPPSSEQFEDVKLTKKDKKKEKKEKKVQPSTSAQNTSGAENEDSVNNKPGAGKDAKQSSSVNNKRKRGSDSSNESRRVRRKF